MNQIELDFQEARRVPVWRWIGIALLALAIIVSVLLIIKNQQNIDATSQLLVEIDYIKHPVKVATKPEDGTKNEALQNQLKEADAVRSQLNLPWANLFKALEETREKDVDLLSVTPNAQTGELLIVGQTENLPLAFAYVERLKKSPTFTNVELNDHQKIIQSSAPALKFSISAHWLASHE